VTAEAQIAIAGAGNFCAAKVAATFARALCCKRSATKSALTSYGRYYLVLVDLCHSEYLCLRVQLSPAIIASREAT
jgi:hypothetical protein